MRVIAPLRGLFTQTLESVIAWLTQSAGHVFPEHTTLGGNSTSAEHTSHQPQPASTVRSQKSEPVLQTIQGQKRGSVNKTAQQQQDQQSIQAGSKSQTLAPPTHQPVKQEQSPLKKVAKRTTLDQLQKQDKAHAQTLTGNPSGESGKSKIPASKTHQRAKPVAKAGKKPVKRATRGKSQK